jgi:hypothetical protein
VRRIVGIAPWQGVKQKHLQKLVVGKAAAARGQKPLAHPFPMPLMKRRFAIFHILTPFPFYASILA